MCVECVRFQFYIKAVNDEFDLTRCKNLFNGEFNSDKSPSEIDSGNSSDSNSSDDGPFFSRKFLEISCFTQSALDFDKYCYVCVDEFRDIVEPKLCILSRSDSFETEIVA